MLNLLLNKKPVQLPDDFSMTMNLKSPIFNEVGNYSYPFKIPNSPKNQFLIGHLNRIEGTGNPYTEFDAKFTWNENHLFAGKGKFKLFNDKSIEGNILDGNGDWNYQFKNNYLQNYDFGSLSFATEDLAIDWMNSCRDKVYPNEPCAFPEIHNEGYFEEMPADTFLHSFNEYFITDDLIHKITQDNNRTLIVPMLYLRFVLEKLFLGMGYRLEDEFFTLYPAFNKLVVYNSVTCNGDPSAPPSAPTFFPYYLTEILFNYHVPYCKVSDFLTGIENMFNLRFFVNNTTRTIRLVPLKDVLTNHAYVDFSTGIISLSTELEEKQGGYKLSMELDGDDSAFESQNATEEEILKFYKGSVNKLSELPVWPSADQLEVRYVISEDKYYRMMNKTWFDYTFDMASLITKYLYLDASIDISTKFSTLIMGGQEGTCYCNNKQANWRDITPRIFFAQYAWYGDHLIVRGNTWDDSGSLFFKPNPFSGGASAPGLFENHYLDWLKWRSATKLVKAIRNMRAEELRDFDFSKKIMINGTKYLVKSIQVTLKKYQIMPATLELYTC